MSLNDYLFEAIVYEGMHVVVIVEKEFWNRHHYLDDSGPYHHDGTLACIQKETGLYVAEIMEAYLEIYDPVDEDAEIPLDVIREKFSAAGLTREPALAGPCGVVQRD